MADVFNEPLLLTREEEARRARDVRYGDLVRPQFSDCAYRSLGVEPLDGSHVRILWDDQPLPPMGPYTVFEGAEWVAIR